MNVLQILQMLLRDGGPVEQAAAHFADRDDVTETELLAELNKFGDAGRRWRAALPDADGPEE